jgi:parvulin-like peptidyl-prolyl isomerase
MKKIILLFIALIFVASCSKGGGMQGNYVLKVDGTALSNEDVQAEINALPEMAKQFFQGPEGATRLVDELAKKEMLYLEAKKRGLDKSKEFDKRVEEFKKVTLINELLQKELAGAANVSEKDAQDYYNNHKDEFMMHSQIRLSQIVVPTEDEARKVFEQLKQGGDFAKVAADVSTDKKSAKAGGDMGLFKQGELAPQIEEAVFKLKKGEISMPVKLQDGFHFFKVTDVKGNIVDFDKVKGMITQNLTNQKQKEAFDKFMESLKKSYKVEINKSELAKIAIGPKLMPAPQAGQMPQPAPEKK